MDFVTGLLMLAGGYAIRLAMDIMGEYIQKRLNGGNMTRLEELESKVSERCKKYEMDCLKCPMNNVCNLYSNANTENEKVKALEKMLSV